MYYDQMLKLDVKTTSTLNSLCRLVLIGALMLSTQVSAQQVETFTLKHRSAESITEQIKAIYPDPHVYVVGRNQQLTVRADHSILIKIGQLLNSLDTPLRQFVISVSNDQNAHTPNKRWSGSGTISTNEGHVQVKSQNKIYQTRGDGNQSITVVEGHAAYVNSGQIKPVRNFQLVNGQIVGSVDYINLTNGVYVAPRFTGNGRVELKIRSHQNEMSRTNQRDIDTSFIDTTRIVQLGEWVNIGGTYYDKHNDQDGINYSTKSKATNQQSMLVKVDLLPE